MDTHLLSPYNRDAVQHGNMPQTLFSKALSIYHSRLSSRIDGVTYVAETA
jgi:hypothetical protein